MTTLVAMCVSSVVGCTIVTEPEAAVSTPDVRAISANEQPDEQETSTALPTVADLLSDPRLSHLADEIRNAKVFENDNLSNDRMKVTLFVPSQEYWDGVQARKIRVSPDSSMLSDLLRKHVVFGDLTPSYFVRNFSPLTQWKPKDTEPTGFEEVQTSVDENGTLRVDGLRVIDTILASNGRVYIIDGMLSLDGAHNSPPTDRDDEAPQTPSAGNEAAGTLLNIFETLEVLGTVDASG